ncbi:magnesium/cobalt transporter CorA [Lentisphaerota bacterium ZTH]|nr:magnesium/cobalt transporter CorA [Lentisphaerota bacterium]WET07345.1 magnesium/cobalt transporter CorA [Lentisphaerota bacterium ZTH]
MNGKNKNHHKKKKKRKHQPGLAPGTPVYTGDETPQKTVINLHSYDREKFDTQVITAAESLPELVAQPGVHWIEISGFADTTLIEQIGEHFLLHSLTIEDILDVLQNPKFEIYENYLVVFLRRVTTDAIFNEFNSTQVCLILGTNYVISFEEKKSNIYDIVKRRLRLSKSRLRLAEVDFLFYSLLDVEVDNYFTGIDIVSEEIEHMEAESFTEPQETTLRNIHCIRQQLPLLKRSVRPLQYIANELRHERIALIRPELHIYFRDLYDHIRQIIESVEIFRDQQTGIMEIYLSNINNQMNKIMQFLTIIGTIFLPLTMVTGVYGMNFRYMPELGWRYGYFMVLAFMLAIAIGMLALFKKKNWI